MPELKMETFYKNSELFNIKSFKLGYVTFV